MSSQKIDYNAYFTPTIERKWKKYLDKPDINGNVRNAIKYYIGNEIIKHRIRTEKIKRSNK